MDLKSLQIRRVDWQSMLDHAIASLPNEACGILGGRDGVVHMVIAVTNAERSPVRYRMDPEEQVQAMLRIEEQGLEITGIFHSHPSGPSGPSISDIDQAMYPQSAYLIWFREEGEWACRAFGLSDEGTVEIPIAVLDV